MSTLAFIMKVELLSDKKLSNLIDELFDAVLLVGCCGVDEL